MKFRRAIGTGVILLLAPGVGTFAGSPQGGVQQVEGSVLAGHVYGADGVGRNAAEVTLFRDGWVAGRRLLLRTAEVSADGDGAFRFAGIAPGQYFLAAAPRPVQGGQPGGRSIEPAPDDYVRTFYPNARDLTFALPVTVTAAANVVPLRIDLQSSLKFAVRGRVVPTPPATGVFVTLVALQRAGEPDSLVDAPALHARNLAPVSRDGSFRFEGVSPGAYRAEITGPGQSVILRSPSQLPPTFTASRGGGPSFRGSSTAVVWLPGPAIGASAVVVVDNDVTDVEIQSAPGATFAGRLLDENGVSLSHELLLEGEAVDRNAYGYRARLVAVKAGVFDQRALVPGRYRISVPGTRRRIKSVQLLGESHAGSAFTLPAGGGTDAVVVLASNAGATVSGIVTTAAPAQRILASLGMVPMSLLNASTLRFLATDAGGQFSFSDVEPGDYQVCGWSTSEPRAFDALNDPRQQPTLDRACTRIRISGSHAANLKLTAIPASALPELPPTVAGGVEDVAARFLEARRVQDWRRAGELLAPEILATLKGLLQGEAATSPGKAASTRVYSESDIAELAAELAVGHAALPMPATATLRILGHTLESGDVAHVVFRRRFSLEDASGPVAVSSLGVLRVARRGGEWKVETALGSDELTTVLALLMRIRR